MPKFKKVSADEARAKRNDHVRKGFSGEVMVKGFKAPASWNKEQRSARFTMSSESVDRMGDIIVQAGLDITRFLQNPQGLLFHNSRSWPIGMWSDVTKVLSGRPKRTEGTLNFLPEGTDEDADRAARHVSVGSIRTVSIGFSPNWDDVEMILDDEGEWCTGFRFNSAEMLEASCVPIPAQPDALVKDVGGDFRLARDLIEEVLDTYAKTPEGLLIPMSEYEKAYRSVVEKISDDASAPAVAATEAKGDEPAAESTKDGDEPECEPMEPEGEQEKAVELTDDVVKAFVTLAAAPDMILGIALDGDEPAIMTAKADGSDAQPLLLPVTMSIADAKAKFAEISDLVATARAAAEPENKTETNAPIMVDTSEVEAAVTKVEGLFSRLAKQFPMFFPKAIEERIEPTIVPIEPPAPPTDEAIAAARAKAAAIRERLVSKDLIAA